MRTPHARFQGSDEEADFQRVASIITACYFAVTSVIVTSLYFQAGPAFSEDSTEKISRSTATLARRAESEKPAGTNLFSQACVKRDAELATEIDIRGDDRAADTNEIADASSWLNAHAVCIKGRTQEARSRYDDVSRVLLRSPELTKR